jgi:hypothetical protein
MAGPTGSSIVRAVKSVLDFKTLTDRIICESFAGKEDMKIAQKDGFEAFLN